jgi:hypothetical protein
MWVALEKKVPLIFWGEPSAEYTAYFSYDEPEQVDEERFNRFVNLGINADDMFWRLGANIDFRDLKPYSYPPLADLRKLNFESVCLGSYVKWDVPAQSKVIMDHLGWCGDAVENVPPKYSYEKIECHMQGVRDYIKYIKRGYSRPSHLAALDLRADRIKLSEAKAMIHQFEGKTPPSLEIFLEMVGLTQDEFYEIAASHTVAPWKFENAPDNLGEKTSDFDKWSRAGKMDRRISSQSLEQWKKN